MALLWKPVYLVSLVGFILFFTNTLRISIGSCIPNFTYIGLEILLEILQNTMNFLNNPRISE